MNSNKLNSNKLNNKQLGVLLIDDNDVSRAMLRNIITSEPAYKFVGQASNGTLGLEMVARLMPDIVCLDVVMDHLGGLEVLEKIKQKWPLMIVLMVSGNKDAETVKTAIQHGADGYIVKPFNPGALLKAIELARFKRGG